MWHLRQQSQQSGSPQRRQLVVWRKTLTFPLCQGDKLQPNIEWTRVAMRCGQGGRGPAAGVVEKFVGRCIWTIADRVAGVGHDGCRRCPPRHFWPLVQVAKAVLDRGWGVRHADPAARRKPDGQVPDLTLVQRTRNWLDETAATSFFFTQCLATTCTRHRYSQHQCQPAPKYAYSISAAFWAHLRRPQHTQVSS